jgi:peptide/nickel transport system ATP-binding protein
MKELLSVNGLTTHYYTFAGTVIAVDDCSFFLNKGETLGIAGESGCGKTTLAMSILRLIQPPNRVMSGSVMYKDVDLLKLTEEEFLSYRWQEISLVLQQSMHALNPMLRISEQMIEPALVKNLLDKETAKKRAMDLLKMVGIESKRIDNYPHEFSGGMKQRVLIALALMLEPEIVILDEPTTALDVVVQNMILKLIDKLKTELELSVIWITHDLAVLSEMCDRIAIMYAGRIVETGYSIDLVLDPKHPYTQGLLASFPTIDDLNKKLKSIPGAPPNLISVPSGCAFHPRCPYATEICQRENPVEEEISGRKDSSIRCHHWKEI